MTTEIKGAIGIADFFVSMKARTKIEVLETSGKKISMIINSIGVEDGSGTKWLFSNASGQKGYWNDTTRSGWIETSN
ncbi:hypothetical protein KJ735_00825 [Patescibacteria group bacterium]|nr:hypothetical protein [Patescibacteria group bacterium]